MNFKKLEFKQILFLILLSAFLLRLFRIDFPNGYIFDEVYHAFTAKEYLSGHKEAWEWWNTPPPGVAYEWTHPPLAKEIMAASMFIFNTEDSWAYRLPGVLFGVLSIFLIYLLGLRLFNDQKTALLASFIFSLDGLNFVQSRTAMNDIYFVTFMLASLLLLLHKKYLFSAILVGLALSSKWSAFYLFPLLFFLVIKDRRFIKLPFFIFIPLGIYLISYLPFFLQGHEFKQFIDMSAFIKCQMLNLENPCVSYFGLQNQMWSYHTNLVATHSYSSPWWSWPLNLYPVWYFVDYGKNSVANIFASGNPIMFWLGSISLVLITWEAFKNKSFNLLFIVLGFLVFWLPWAFSPRIMFLYHFSPSVPFLSLALAYKLYQGFKEKQSAKLALVLLGLIIFSFIVIYPFLTAIPLPREAIRVFFVTNLGKNPF